jgi:HlyD family secretion protein
MKVDVQVDELDISKVKVGQSANISFDAISDKAYTGTVQSISQMGTTTNNVTTYDVIVGVNNPDGVKLGMNANVSINVTSKADALTIPIEALIERNNKKYVMVKSGNSSDATSSNSSGQGSWSRSGNSGNGNGSYSRSGNSGNGGNGSYSKGGSFGGSGNGSGNGNSRISTSGGKLVEVQTGLQNETTVEITSGLTEGQQVMIQLPQVSSSTSQRSGGGFGGLGGGSFGGFGGGGGGSKQGGSSGSSNNSGSSNSSSSNSGGSGK